MPSKLEYFARSFRPAKVVVARDLPLLAAVQVMLSKAKDSQVRWAPCSMAVQLSKWVFFSLSESSA